MFSSRRFALLPPQIQLTIHQHLDPSPFRLRPNLYAQPQALRTNQLSFLSKVGISNKEERFKQALNLAIEQAQSPRNWSTLPATYNRLLSEYRHLRGSDQFRSFVSTALSQLMLNLTRTRTPNRIVDRVVGSIFQDIKAGLWEISPTPEHYLAIIKCRAQSEDFDNAEAALRECMQTFPFSTIPSRLFIAILGEYRRYNDYQSIWRVYQTIKGNNRVLDRRIYDLVQDALISSPSSFFHSHILDLQKDFDQAKLGTVSKLTLLLMTFVALKQPEEAKNAALKLKQALEHSVVVRYPEYKGWEALIRYTFMSGDQNETPSIIKQARDHGFVPYSSLFHRIVIDRQITTVERLRECEKAFSLEADTVTWSLVIHQALAADGIDAALSVYEESKKQGVIPAAYTLHPLMRSLCGGHLRRDLQWKNLERALELYGDLLGSIDQSHESNIPGEEGYEDTKTLEPTPTSNVQSKNTPEKQQFDGSKLSQAFKPWVGPDSMIYDTLLRGISQLARTTDAKSPLLAVDSTKISHIFSDTIQSYDAPDAPSQRSKGMSLWDLALKLLEDMRRLNIPSSPMSTTAIIILCMRIAPTFRDAFQVYRSMANGERLRRSDTFSDGLEDLAALSTSSDQYLNQFNLNGTSYENLIRGFCTLKPKQENGVLIYPPADLYLEMVKDMQVAGHVITEDVYMTFLYRLGRQARALRLWEKEVFPSSVEDEEVEGGTDLEELDLKNVDPVTLLNTRQSILHGIRTMHNHIVLNAGITPSVDLLNAMLDAYNKVASVHDAFKVWDTIFLSRIYNNQSVSIILDTCGWAKVGHKASQIWNQLVLRDFIFNKNNWDSRVECLCRIGKLDDALKVVCLEMPTQNNLNALRREKERVERGPLLTKDGQLASKIASRVLVDAEEKEGNIMPDLKTLGVLFSFAEKTNQVEEVRTRVKQYLPQVWQSVPSRQKSAWFAGANRETGDG
ncbi:hypothetical protein CPB86DRAFT_696671 [Serendipita vermifera]|nr:hypothetical protein CPB86DRAFT_696671 [Serendipita vermifera]